MDTNKISPIKKHVLGNKMPFMTREISKEIMTKWRLRNYYLIATNMNKWFAFLRNAKNIYYDNLYEKDLTDNKNVWKNVKPYLSDKLVTSDKIHLNENGGFVKSKF